MGRPKRPHTRTSKYGNLFKAGKGVVAWGKKQMNKKNAKAVAVIGTAVAAKVAMDYIKRRSFVENTWDHVTRKREFDYRGYNPSIFRGMGSIFLGTAQHRPAGETSFDLLFFATPFHVPNRTEVANAVIIGDGDIVLAPSASDYLNWTGDVQRDPRLWVTPMEGEKVLQPGVPMLNVAHLYTDPENNKTTMILTTGQAIDFIGNSMIKVRRYTPGEWPEADLKQAPHRKLHQNTEVK